MFQRIVFNWQPYLINRLLDVKYLYQVSSCKIGFYDDNVNVITRSHVKNMIYQSIHQTTVVLKITFKRF